MGAMGGSNLSLTGQRIMGLSPFQPFSTIGTSAELGMNPCCMINRMIYLY